MLGYMGRLLGLLPELKGYMSKKEQISKAAFGYLKEVTSAPVNETFINADYYQGFMHGVTACMIYIKDCKDGDDFGEFALRKWLNIKDER